MSKCAPRNAFFGNHEPDRVLEMSRLSYWQNMLTYYPSGKDKLSTRSFLEYWYRIVFVHDMAPFKRIFGE